MDGIWTDTMLTTEDIKVLKAAVVETPLWGISARKVLSTKKIDPGLRSYGFQTISDVGTADSILPAADFPGININGALSSVNVAKIGNAFALPREDILSAKRSNLALDTKTAEHASQLVQKKENDIIWNGDVKFAINGILADATGAYTSDGWGGGSDNPYEDVRKAWAQVADAYSDRRMALVCHRDNFGQLLKKNQYTDMSYKTMIEQDLNIFPVMDVNYTSGTACLIPEGADVAEVVVAEDLDMEMNYQNADNQVYKGLVYVRSAPVVYVPGAIVKITSIDAD